MKKEVFPETLELLKIKNTDVIYEDENSSLEDSE